MRKPKISVLPVITIVFAAFTVGFFFGRNQSRQDLSVSVPAAYIEAPSLPPETTSGPSETIPAVTFPILLNQADKETIMALPGIGEVLAERIVAYRLENGSFTSPEELLNVEGIGKKRLEEILDFISIGG